MSIVQLTTFDHSLDISKKLEETESAIRMLEDRGMSIPDEALEIRAMARRAIAAEQLLDDVKNAVNTLAGFIVTTECI